MFSKVIIIALLCTSVATANPIRFGLKGGMMYAPLPAAAAAAPHFVLAPTKGASFAAFAPIQAPVQAPSQGPEPAFYEQSAQRTASVSATKGSYVATSAAPAAPLQQSSMSQSTLSQSTVAEPALTQSVSSSSVKGGFSSSQQSVSAPVQSTVSEVAPQAPVASAPVKGSAPLSSGPAYQFAQAPAVQENQSFAAKGSGPSFVQSSAPIAQSTAPITQSSAPVAQSSAPVVEAAPSVQQVDSAPVALAAPAKGTVSSQANLAQTSQQVVAAEQKSA